jgi:hypothetical protein
VESAANTLKVVPRSTGPAVIPSVRLVGQRWGCTDMSQNELFALALCLSWVARLPFSNWTLPEFGDALIQPVNTALSLVRRLRKGVGRLGA